MFLKNIKKIKSEGENFHDSASTALIDDYDKTLLDIIDCQKSGFTRKSVVLMLVKIKQFIMIMRTYVRTYVRTWHGAACNQRPRQRRDQDLGLKIENSRPKTK